MKYQLNEGEVVSDHPNSSGQDLIIKEISPFKKLPADLENQKYLINASTQERTTMNQEVDTEN